jgi:hypothetical protein
MVFTRTTFKGEQMKHTGLMTQLKASGLKLHRSRLEFLSLLMIALVQAKTVNLASLVGMMEGKAQVDSFYRRAQRFFQSLRLADELVLKHALGLHPQKRYSLCLDRTNWKFGKLDINILTLAYAHEGVAIPLLWCLLPKTGNSNTQERIALLERLLKFLPLEQIEVLLADREFIGGDWFAHLCEQNLPFVIRVRKDALGDGWFYLFKFFQHLPLGEHKVLKQRYAIFGITLAVAGVRLADGDYVIVVTNRNPKQALASYAKRWQIECLFKALKSSGFDFEATHLKHLDRINTLLVVVSLAFLWALKVGEFIHQLKPVPLKSHGRKQKSLFRTGLDHLRHLLANSTTKSHDLDTCFRLLSCT